MSLQALWKEEVSADSDTVPYETFKEAVLRMAAADRSLAETIERGDRSVLALTERQGIAVRKQHLRHPFLGEHNPASRADIHGTGRRHMHCMRLATQHPATPSRP